MSSRTEKFVQIVLAETIREKMWELHEEMWTLSGEALAEKEKKYRAFGEWADKLERSVLEGLPDERSSASLSRLPEGIVLH